MGGVICGVELCWCTATSTLHASSDTSILIYSTRFRYPTLAHAHYTLSKINNRRLPQPGQGPSRDLMLNGYWKHKMIGVLEGGDQQVGWHWRWHWRWCAVMASVQHSLLGRRSVVLNTQQFLH